MYYPPDERMSSIIFKPQLIELKLKSVSKPMQFSQFQLGILLALNCLITSLFIMNFIFIMHNLYKYIYGLKIYRTLIVIFYILITLSTACRIFQYVCRALDPENSYFGGQSKYEQISGEIALFFMICIGLTLIATMYQLTMSLQIVLGEISEEQLARRNIAVRVLAVITMISYGTLVIYIETQLGFDYIYNLWIPFYACLATLYVAVILLLNSKMRQLKGGFNMEIKSINKQFIVFLFAYLTRIVWWVALVMSDQKFANFYGCIFVTAIQVIWNVMPIFYSLVQQHKVFKIIAKKSEKMAVTTTAKSSVNTSQDFQRYATAANQSILKGDNEKGNPEGGRPSIQSEESVALLSPRMMFTPQNDRFQLLETAQGYQFAIKEESRSFIMKRKRQEDLGSQQTDD